MLDVLRSVIQEVSRAGDLQSVLEIIVERVHKTMKTEVCSIYLKDKDRQRYVFMATRGLNQEAVGKVSLGLNEGLVGYVGERAEPINLEDAQDHPRNRFFEEIGEESYHAFLGVPIIHHRELLGVLIVQQQQSRRFDESEEAFLITLSAQLAGVIAHAEATGALALQGRSRKSVRFKGMQGAPGVAIGTVVVAYPEAELHKVPERKVTDVELEIKKFRLAVDKTRKDISAIIDKLADRLQPEELALFEAYLHMLDDTAISGEVIEQIRTGEWSQSSLRKVIATHVTNFEAMEDEYLRERGSDLRALGNKVLVNLQAGETRPRRYPQKTVLVSNELTPADLALVPRNRIAGFVSVRGSGKSHVAILAEAMGVPTIMGVKGLPIELLDGATVIVDGFSGSMISYPKKAEKQYYERIAMEEQAFFEGLDETRDQACYSKDGHRIGLWVNTGLISDVQPSLDRGAEGVGLYRSETQFMMNDRFPTEEEQLVIYREHLRAFAPRPVTMRTLDIGGDKALPYFPIKEENPFLGWRGMRITLDHPEIFLSQIRAMIRASAGIDTKLRIMFPMITSTTEIEEAKNLVTKCHQEIVEEGVEVEMPEVGVMIEVPAAVYQARDIVRRVDFLSVGSNDLIQYLLAVDRNNVQVSELYEEFHPAVLHALYQVVQAARKEKKPVGICGEMAGNPSAAVLLMSMGFDVLSMNSTSLLIVKYTLSHFDLEQGKNILSKVLGMDNANVIKKFMDEEMHKVGLSNIVRSRRYG